MRRLVRRIPVRLWTTILFGVAAACSQPPTAPSTADVPAPTTTTASICHRVDDTGSYALKVMPESEVPPHLAHGDGRVAELVPDQSNSRFGAACEIVPLRVVTITFDGLAGKNGAAVTDYEESGFVVTATRPAWEVMGNYGNPKPAIIFKRPTTDPDLEGEVRITSREGPFTFSSVDIYSSVTRIPYVISGERKSIVGFTLSDTIPNTFGHFKTVSSGERLLIDTLVIRVTNPATPCCANPVGIDSVVVER